MAFSFLYLVFRGIDRFAVVGGSWGGPHSLAVAARLPGRVTRAACIAGVAPFDMPGFDWFADMDAVKSATQDDRGSFLRSRLAWASARECPLSSVSTNGDSAGHSVHAHEGCRSSCARSRAVSCATLPRIPGGTSGVIPTRATASSTSPSSTSPPGGSRPSRYQLTLKSTRRS